MADNYLIGNASGDIAHLRTALEEPLESCKVSFEPVQAGSGDPSPSNVRAISGWNGATVSHGSKNLLKVSSSNRVYFKDTYSNFVEENGIVSINGSVAGGFVITCCPNTTYTYSLNSTYLGPNMAIRVYAYAQRPTSPFINIDHEPDWLIVDKTRVDTATFTTPSYANYLIVGFYAYNDAVGAKISNMQIELGSQRTVYEPYRGNETTVSWQTSAGTVYGGYIDFVTGELVKEWHSYTFTGDETFYTDGTWVTFQIPYVDGIRMLASYPYKGVCSHYPYAPYKQGSVGVMYNERNCIFDGTLRDADGWKQFVKDQYDAGTPLTISYKLAEPIRYQLTPQQINTFKGVNNFWSTAGTIDVSYCFKDAPEMLKLRRQIELSSPHLETASGSIASFKTDVPSKLKECKVYFEPKQEGSGTPSPDNVRNIVGWDGVTLYKAGKNIVNIVGFSARNTTNPSATRSATNDYGTTISTTEPASSLIITQSQAPDAQNYQHYRNGYFVIIDDNLEYGQNYRVSFIVTDIISNPLGASLDNWVMYGPYNVSSSILYGNKVSAVVRYNRHPSATDRHGIEVRNCGMSCTISEIMVTPVTDEDITYEPPSPLEIPISFGRTIYGGYIDLVSGELVATHAKVVLDGSSDEQWDGSTHANGWRRLRTNPAMKVGDWYEDPMTMCDRFTKVATSDGNISTEPQIKFGTDTTSDIYCYYLSSSIGVNTLEEFKTWLSNNPMTVTYPLATPLRYSLPPQTIRTLKGVNNIFTVEDNTTLTATYWTH